LVADAAKAPVPGTLVTFSIDTGSGKLSATSVATDARGEASTTLTLGSAAGPVTVRAAAAGVTATVVFHATALPTSVLATAHGDALTAPPLPRLAARGGRQRAHDLQGGPALREARRRRRERAHRHVEDLDEAPPPRSFGPPDLRGLDRDGGTQRHPPAGQARE